MLYILYASPRLQTRLYEPRLHHAVGRVVAHEEGQDEVEAPKGRGDEVRRQKQVPQPPLTAFWTEAARCGRR